MNDFQQALSGAIAGFVSRLIVAPFDVVKIRLQLQTHKAHQKKYKSLIQSAKVIVSQEGIKALWKGNMTASYLYVTFGGVQFYVFSYCQKLAGENQMFYRYVPQNLHTFTSGGLAGLAATFLTFPFDVLRTRFAAQGNIVIYKSTIDAIRQVYLKEGLMGYYRGLVPSLLQIIPQMGLIFESHDRLTKKYDQIQVFF
jgi:solute carrier family 25 thiamine pyrophosphate transporter 19